MFVFVFGGGGKVTMGGARVGMLLLLFFVFLTGEEIRLCLASFWDADDQMI
jgi:hypothetical protein